MTLHPKPKTAPVFLHAPVASQIGTTIAPKYVYPTGAFPAGVDATEVAERTKVCDEARLWVGTRYLSMADTKGVGIDCAMLLVRVYVDTGLIDPVDPRPYPATWFVHQGEERYLGWLNSYANEVPATEVVPGNVAVWKFGRCFAHSAIVISPQIYIHAFIKDRIASYGEWNHVDLKDRPMKMFDPWAGKRAGKKMKGSGLGAS